MADEPYDPKKHGDVVASPQAAVVAPDSVVRVRKEEPFDPAKHGDVKPSNIDEEIADWKRYGITPPTKPDQYGVHDPGASATQDAPAKPKLEYPDAKTVARIPLPPQSAISDKDVYGRPAIPFSSSMALQFGPLMTSDPIARQQIVAKHLPGAVPTQDKYGNPMIEYKGEKYYMSRPGEFDATDASRLAAGVVASAPAALLAPESLIGASLLTGATAGVQSLGEDVATRAAGGEHQQIDLPKAGTSAVISSLVPFGLGKLLAPVAGETAAAVRVPLADAAIEAMGFTKQQIANMTPELRQVVSDTARKTFGNQQAVQSAYRTGILKEQGITPGLLGGPTRGEITGDVRQIAKEQTLAGPGNPSAQGTILENRVAQDVNLNQAQERLRTEAAGGQPPQSPIEAAQTLKGNFETARDASKANVGAKYDVAKDPQAVVAAGGAPNAPAAYVQQVGGSVRSHLATTPQGQAVLENAGLTPNATQALAAVDKFAQDVGRGPAGPRNALDWEAVENMRKRLNLYRDAAFGAGGTPTDQAAMKAVIDGFDQHFTPLNPLLADARAAHAEHISIFKPGGSPDQDRATKTALQLLAGPEEGAKVANSIFANANKGDAIQLLDHLQTKVFPNQPEALNVLKDQAIRRLTVNAESGKMLTPQEQATAIAKALDGDAQGPLYARIFSGQELAGLRRYHEAVTMLGQSRTKINPPGSGLLSIATLKALGATGGGAAIGGHIGAMIGMPELGATAGAGAGALASQVIPRMQAARAVSPPANYGVTPNVGQPAMVGGLLANQGMQTPQQGPADKIVNGLLMRGP
jgi:hypothetical protein